MSSKTVLLGSKKDKLADIMTERLAWLALATQLSNDEDSDDKRHRKYKSAYYQFLLVVLMW